MRISLRELIGLVTIVALLIGVTGYATRLSQLRAELEELRQEVGYLPRRFDNELAAITIPTYRPLTYRLRVRIPNSTPDDRAYRLAYSTVWPEGTAGPRWYAAMPVSPGESVINVEIAPDPKDQQWKIAVIVRSGDRTNRLATSLPQEHVDVFQGAHKVLSQGVGRQASSHDVDRPLRLIDRRWLAGEGGLMLYEDRPPPGDQIGVFVELQPDTGPL
ncbi:hypothetical protein Mal65_35770 [Crateriforma conspicua]|nr:hypothetical protein Mal65_35770 [Crateriforma conspicua]